MCTYCMLHVCPSTAWAGGVRRVPYAFAVWVCLSFEGYVLCEHEVCLGRICSAKCILCVCVCVHTCTRARVCV